MLGNGPESGPGSGPEPVTIRAAGPFSGPLLAGLHADAFPPAERWDAPAMETLLSMPGVVAGLGWHRAAPVPRGFIMGRVVADEAEILTLAVAGDARRQGLGHALLAWLADQAARRGAARLFLEVSAANPAAQALYRGAGFAEIGRRRAYYPDGSDALVLSRVPAPHPALSPP
ncbi:ribosomal protein S18-alanine N-acetyltransferase [Nguyenibacter sp. L1]|uniref:ribosomal protein S18-alanine N-acetyltransferase n=1 Tax=Nguyenibacter sp. L1 TaxID=3049350 RepID=UPI0038D20997